ncbi:MAG: type II toxin-antitoxin system RelB/DinJ family antitoxin, partial [Clostridia bacterium]|nr:type II toxin-antitoxin system RelB/DinJ family antitoxin [Clostridia bacterium]
MKDATISVRIDSELKEQAEAILKQLGIPVSVLIDAMYRQVVIQQGLP